MDTFVFIGTTGREVPLASSGEKLGGSPNILQLRGQPPDRGFPAPNSSSWGCKTRPAGGCWPRWHAGAPSPALSPTWLPGHHACHVPSGLAGLSCSHLCGPASTTPLLNGGVCQARSLDFILPPSLTLVYTLKYLHPYPDPSLEFKSWSGPPLPPLISRFTDVNRFPWTSPRHLKTQYLQKWTPDLSPQNLLLQPTSVYGNSICPVCSEK